MFFLSFLFINFFVFSKCDDNIQIKISDGILEGKILKSKDGRKFGAFQGIPFAEPPLGELRFKAPKPNKPWNGVLDATQPHPLCAQWDTLIRTGTIKGQEDCLYLNVYTPKISNEENELLPVMVFIHGGGFFFGSGNSEHYGPEFLLDHDIILVAMNYRLGVFGFLSTGDEISPGNNGLKDQSLALKWINKNIKHFGGNPESVTIFGESAGAASTHFHMISPLSKGLFHRVICESGSALHLWALDSGKENVEYGKKLGKLLNCPTESSEKLVDCLRKIDAYDLIKPNEKLLKWDIDPAIIFQPVIEGHSSGSFLPDSPENLFKTGQFEDVPLLIGVNTDEGFFRASIFEVKPELLQELKDDLSRRLAISLFYEPFSDDLDFISQKIIDFYFGGSKNLEMNSFDNFIKMYSDGWFNKGTNDALLLHRNVSKQPIYSYLFGYESDVSFSQIYGNPSIVKGVSHLDELLYLFPIADSLFPNKKENENDRKVRKLMTELWTNFAKTGNPNGWKNTLIQTEWKPVSSGKLEYYYINSDKQEMRNGMFEERMKFWKTLPIKSNSGKFQVELSDGKLRGNSMKTMGGREFYAFQGIPYAEPPLGPLRFKAPVPVKPWDITLDATRTHAVCPQRDAVMKKNVIEGDEDCLYLNVYTPKLYFENRELLPVMIFIHGGGFFTGSGNYDHYGPELLLDRDIVLVTFNYRLGPLGFLTTGDEFSPGNSGLKDQSLVLKWVQKNIKYFSGNPEKVTIFGESAGAASVHFHMLSPMSRGLFKGAISQSGSAFNVWALITQEEGIEKTKKLAEGVNCPTISNREMIECLRNSDVKLLLSQDSKFMEWDVDPLMPFRPVIEPPSPEAFLSDTPSNIYKSGEFEDVPWIVGINSDEGVIKVALFMGFPELLNELNEDFNNKIFISLACKSRFENHDAIANKFKEFYLKNKKIDLNTNIAGLVDLYSDIWFTKGLDTAIRHHLEYSKQPVFNYLFTHKGDISFSQLYGHPEPYGVSHLDELLYLFPNGRKLLSKEGSGENGKKMIEILTKLWENFAKTGNPTPGLENSMGDKWERVTTDNLEYLKIDAEKLEMKEILLEDRVEFLRNLPSNSRKPLKKDEL